MIVATFRVQRSVDSVLESPTHAAATNHDVPIRATLARMIARRAAALGACMVSFAAAFACGSFGGDDTTSAADAGQGDALTDASLDTTPVSPDAGVDADADAGRLCDDPRFVFCADFDTSARPWKFEATFITDADGGPPVAALGVTSSTDAPSSPNVLQSTLHPGGSGAVAAKTLPFVAAKKQVLRFALRVDVASPTVSYAGIASLAFSNERQLALVLTPDGPTLFSFDCGPGADAGTIVGHPLSMVLPNRFANVRIEADFVAGTADVFVDEKMVLSGVSILKNRAEDVTITTTAGLSSFSADVDVQVSIDDFALEQR